MKRLTSLLILGLVVVVPSATASRNASTPSPAIALVVWAGGMAPWETLHGVALSRDGQGQLLRVVPRDRAAGKVTVVGRFRPPENVRAAIRRAALAAASGRSVSVERNGSAGRGYAAAVIKVDSKVQAVLGVDSVQPGLAGLLTALNAALPSTARLPGPALEGATAGTRARTGAASSVDCAKGSSATSITRNISLQEAARAGIVELKSKGMQLWDSVAVDAVWKDLQVAVTVKTNIEITPPVAKWASAVENVVEAKLRGKQIDGTPINFDLAVRTRRPGSPPTPCFHQITLSPDSSRSGVDDLIEPNSRQTTWGVWQSGDPRSWPHETLHLVGLDDQYDAYFEVGGATYPIPANLNSSDESALLAWAGAQSLDPRNGVVRSKPKPGRENDIMADRQNNCCLAEDLRGFLRRAWLRVQSRPGDLLFNKNVRTQNLGVAGFLDIDLAPGGIIHLDGLFAYCTDRFRNGPREGDVLDVAGRAGESSDPAMQALQKVLDEIARTNHAGGDIEAALKAVWFVTDNVPRAEDPQAQVTAGVRKILEGAGISPDTVFNAPHFNNPNAAAPDTGAVTPTTVLPPIPTPPPQQPPARPDAKLVGLSVRATVRHPPRGLLLVRVRLANGGDRVALRLDRRAGKSWRRAQVFPARAIDEGQTSFALVVPKLQPASYRLTVSGKAGSKQASFTVRRATRQ